MFPLFFSTFGLGVERIGIIKAVYPAVWGTLQVVTGPLSDRWGRKALIVGGMWVQAAGIFVTLAGRSFGWWLLGSVLLGVGTAMVYPTLIAAADLLVDQALGILPVEQTHKPAIRGRNQDGTPPTLPHMLSHLPDRLVGPERGRAVSHHLLDFHIWAGGTAPPEAALLALGASVPRP